MWDGVTNNAALKNIRAMQKGDVAIIYHTGDERALIGIADVTRGYYVNPEHDDARLAVCDVRAEKRLSKSVTLAQVKAREDLQSWDLVRQARLSVVPVSDEQWKIVCAMSEAL